MNDSNNISLTRQTLRKHPDSFLDSSFSGNNGEAENHSFIDTVSPLRKHSILFVFCLMEIAFSFLIRLPCSFILNDNLEDGGFIALFVPLAFASSLIGFLLLSSRCFFSKKVILSFSVLLMAAAELLNALWDFFGTGFPESNEEVSFLFLGQLAFYVAIHTAAFALLNDFLKEMFLDSAKTKLALVLGCFGLGVSLSVYFPKFIGLFSGHSVSGKAVSTLMSLFFMMIFLIFAIFLPKDKKRGKRSSLFGVLEMILDSGSTLRAISFVLGEVFYGFILAWTFGATKALWLVNISVGSFFFGVLAPFFFWRFKQEDLIGVFGMICPSFLFLSCFIIATIDTSQLGETLCSIVGFGMVGSSLSLLVPVAIMETTKAVRELAEDQEDSKDTELINQTFSVILHISWGLGFLFYVLGKFLYFEKVISVVFAISIVVMVFGRIFRLFGKAA